MKKLTVRLNNYISPYYPIEARYTINRVSYNLVFTTVSEAKSYFSNRFFPVEINFIDTTK